MDSFPNRSGKPLPKYTSIDLESELPEIFSTNLNPQLRDPDMSSFYSQPNLGRYNYPHPKGSRHSPPPLYDRSSGKSEPSTPTLFAKAIFPLYRKQVFWISFFIVFFMIPLLILFVFGLLPQLLTASQYDFHISDQRR